MSRLCSSASWLLTCLGISLLVLSAFVTPGNAFSDGGGDDPKTCFPTSCDTGGACATFGDPASSCKIVSADPCGTDSMPDTCN